MSRKRKKDGTKKKVRGWREQQRGGIAFPPERGWNSKAKKKIQGGRTSDPAAKKCTLISKAKNFSSPEKIWSRGNRRRRRKKVINP